MPPTDLALITGATLRLIRLVTADDLGEWWIRQPAYQAALRHAVRAGESPWWDKYRAGLDCPHCCGFWIGTAVLASHAVAGKTRSWRFAAAALTLSYVAGHVSAHLDSVPDLGDATS